MHRYSVRHGNLAGARDPSGFGEIRQRHVNLQWRAIERIYLVVDVFYD